MAVAVLDARRALRQVMPDSVESELLEQIDRRKSSIDSEMKAFGHLCDRWDELYYPETVLEHAGASHWASHPSATTEGQAHISVNTPPAYVDIPASLQAVPGIENMVSGGGSPDDRRMASMVERIRVAWKNEVEWDLLVHKACVVKGLYGRTAAKVTWDPERKRPEVTIIDQPRHLYLGWGQSDYTKLNWALYIYRLSPESVMEEWGLEVDQYEDEAHQPTPIVRDAISDMTGGSGGWRRLPSDMQVEVYDYWYRKPKPRKGRSEVGRPVSFETWNAIFVGNFMVKNERHPEYDGEMPYVPLFNTYIPGIPDGKPELFDIEPLIREVDERLTGGAQMFNKTLHQPWQLTGPEAPDVVPPGLRPIPDKVIAPGAGNRIEGITPWNPEFQLEQFLSRLDREKADVSGLNDLLRGLAPASVLSSSKAIATLVANYEARIRMKRDLLYVWNRNVWHKATGVWSHFDKMLGEIFKTPYMLDIQPPSLVPRDDMEQASRATSLMMNKVWSQRRAMDQTGVDDPETEQQMIREERTDATQFPNDVQQMAQLMMVLQQMGYLPPPGAQQMLGQQAQSMGAPGMPPGAMGQQQMLAQSRAAMGGATGSPMMNAPEEQVQLPPEAMPGNTPEGAAAGAANAGGDMVAQTMLKNGQVSNRILSNQQIGG